MLFPLPRRRTDSHAVYLRAAEIVLGPPGTRAVTALHVLLAHDIAWQNEDLLRRTPDRTRSEEHLQSLAEHYGVTMHQLSDERSNMVTTAALQPRRRPARVGR
ncbi:MAG: hypothetical protein JWM64_2683 [Frankiales bacterium]|nr:hypothetical protein [Frankiales bacterium]